MSCIVTLLLNVPDQLELTELHLGMGEEETTSLWVRIKVRAGAGGIVVGVCYRSPKQEYEADESLYRQWISLRFTGPGPHRGIHLDIYWRSNIAGHYHSRKLLECINGNFLLQVIEETMRRGAVLNDCGKVGHIELKGSLGCSAQEV